MNPPTTDAELNASYRELVEWIMEHAGHPIRWPLEDRQRIWFVRDAMMRAKTIRNSEPFLRGEVAVACREFVESGKRKKKPTPRAER